VAGWAAVSAITESVVRENRGFHRPGHH
jgi:hypothetical protein